MRQPTLNERELMLIESALWIAAKKCRAIAKENENLVSYNDLFLAQATECESLRQKIDGLWT